jgi:hypothetical protein
MNNFEATLVMTTLFFLRLGLPLLVTLIFGYGMNRLMDHRPLDVEP